MRIFQKEYTDHIDVRYSMDYQVKVCQKQKKNVLHGRNSPKIPKESIIIKKNKLPL